MLKIGDRVRFAKWPPWVDDLNNDEMKSRDIFRFCFGKIYKIIDISEGNNYALDVSRRVDKKFGGYGNSIYLEEEYLEKIG